MHVEVLTVADCPHRTTFLARLHEALHQIGAGDVAVTERVVDTPADAELVGMHGSPTVLVNGGDLFADRSTTASLSCRLYPTAAGLQGAPTVATLVAALQARR